MDSRRTEGGVYEKRPLWVKFFQGVCFAFGLILLVIAPILLFSGLNPLVNPNPIISGKFSI
jgi:formate/nitrite transporter FocA (FNT family)